MRDSPLYTIGFAAAVCVVCAVLVATATVALRDAQAQNRALDRQKKVLAVAGLLERGERLSGDEIRARYAERVEPALIHLEDGSPVAEGDPASFDARAATQDPARSRPAPDNRAGLVRLAENAIVYQVRGEDGAGSVVLPVHGKGLWSTMYGFLALDRGDLRTIRGIEFFEHGETPGLGGEVDNPRWKAEWEGRLAFDQSGAPAIQVARGEAGPPEEDPYKVDALTGATLTARGVTNLVQFWLGEKGYGPYLERLEQGEVAQ